jgi:tetrapyrrole methylase family protein/MazG family protein
MPKAPENLREFSSLLKVVEFLRGPDGCPWDKEQTHQSLTRFAIEEAFELGEAIDGGDVEEMKGELGDLLLQVVLHSEIARQEKRFDVFDVIATLNEKMVRRHPHVFGDVKVKNSGEVLANWSQIKAAEKGQKEFVFDIPVALPSLIRSQKIGEKTEKIGFDWDSPAAVWDKVKEEIGELEKELHSLGDHESVDASAANLARIEGEIGDAFFSLAQLARHLGLDAEQCSRKANAKFETRFAKMRELVKVAGKDWDKLGNDEKEKFWQLAKRELKS